MEEKGGDKKDDNSSKSELEFMAIDRIKTHSDKQL
jgi:hypothetical protein